MEIPIGGPEGLDSVTQVNRSNASIVNGRAGQTGIRDLALQNRKRVGRLADWQTPLRTEPRRDRSESNRRRRWRREDSRVRTDQ